jgi:tRNA uridine 5-carbamoylmethylation protein Kti12
MKLIIIKGPHGSGKTLIANLFFRKNNNYRLDNCILDSLTSFSYCKSFLIEKYDYIIIDDPSLFSKEKLDYLKSQATEIKTITIEVERKHGE